MVFDGNKLILTWTFPRGLMLIVTGVEWIDYSRKLQVA